VSLSCLELHARLSPHRLPVSAMLSESEGRGGLGVLPVEITLAACQLSNLDYIAGRQEDGADGAASVRNESANTNASRLSRSLP